MLSYALGAQQFIPASNDPSENCKAFDQTEHPSQIILVGQLLLILYNMEGTYNSFVYLFAIVRDRPVSFGIRSYPGTAMLPGIVVCVASTNSAIDPPPPRR